MRTAIAQYCKALEPRPWQKPTEAQTKLQELTRYQHRLKRQKAAEQTKLQTAPAYLLPLIQSTITHLQQQIKAVQNQLNQFHKDNPDYKIQKRAPENHHRHRRSSGQQPFVSSDPKGPIQERSAICSLYRLRPQGKPVRNKPKRQTAYF